MGNKSKITDPSSIPTVPKDLTPADVERLAEFWDEHSPLDFEPDVFNLEDADDDNDDEADDGGDDLVQISVRLRRRDVDALKAAAHRTGVGYTTFVRMILHRAVDQPQP